MEKPVLCLSWLNGQLKATAVERGTVLRSWERPGLVADFTDFAAVVAEAVEKTQTQAKHVNIVLAHPRLSHQVVEVPPVKGRTLERVLQRHVQRLKTFSDEGAWASQPAMATKKSNALLLHIFPQSLVDDLIKACEGIDLQLIKLLPTTAVLGPQLKLLPLQKDELALIAAETGATTTIVIGGNDGRVCLGRVLRSRWNQQSENLVVDLTRTIGFAEQQSGLQVASVWLFGTAAQAQAPALQLLLHLPVKISPVECTPFYWAEQAAKLPDQNDGNLISREVRQAPQRRRLVTATGLILLLLLVASLAAAGFIDVVRRGWEKTIEKENIAMIKLKERRADLKKQHSGEAGQRELVRIVLDEKPPPVPSWLLGYMSEAVPEELLLTELRVVRTNESWFVKLAGAAQPTTNSSPAAVFRQAASVLTNRLATGPFHLKISRCMIGEGVEKSSLPSETGKGTNTTFLIEGMIQ